jgi:hypothetical protein
MQQKIVREIEALERMSVPELREKYQEVFGAGGACGGD